MESNVLSLVQPQIVADPLILEHTKQLLELVESGQVIQLCFIAIDRGGNVTTLRPSFDKPFTMLGAITSLQIQYESAAIAR